MRDQLFSCHYGFSSFYTELCLMSECTGDSPSSSNSHPFYFTPSPSPCLLPFLSLPLLLSLSHAHPLQTAPSVPASNGTEVNSRALFLQCKSRARPAFLR